MTASYPMYVYRDPHFAPAGDTVISVAPIELVNLVYGVGEGSRQAALMAAFGGAAVFKDEATDIFYLGIWGKRNASRFSAALRRHAHLEIMEAPPPGHLMYFSRGEKRPTRDHPDQS
jgi:hypothetical protein